MNQTTAPNVEVVKIPCKSTKFRDFNDGLHEWVTANPELAKLHIVDIKLVNQPEFTGIIAILTNTTVKVQRVEGGQNGN